MSKPTSRRKPKDERRAHEHYPTQQIVADYAVSNFLPQSERHMNILDPGAGTGPFARALRSCWPDASMTLHGVDIALVPPGRTYDAWWRGDFRAWARNRPVEYDIVLGNPPYDIAEAFIWNALHVLKPGGHLLFLLALEFMSSVGRYAGLFATAPPRHINISARRLDFTGSGGDMRNHVFVLWTKGWRGVTTTSWFDYRQDLRQLALPA